MSESAAAAAAEAASTAMPQSDNAEVDEIAKAGVKVAAYMVTLALTVLPGIIIAILAFVAFFKIKRRGDHARAGVPWFKAAGGLACLWILFAIIGPILMVVVFAKRDKEDGNDSWVLQAQQFPLLTDMFMYLVFSLLLVAQMEFAVGLKYVCTISREENVASFVQGTSRRPRAVAIVCFLLTFLLNIGLLVSSELHYSGKTSSKPMVVMDMILNFFLFFWAVGSLVHTAIQPRAQSHKSLRGLLVALGVMTMLRHLCFGLVSGALNIALRKVGAGQVNTVSTSFRSCFGAFSFVITQGLAYGAVNKLRGGLWANDAIATAKLGHDEEED
ncbi:unnamed protein product [Clonostachys rhizophaga]|uniref:Uncharacterized protein n=1 Tax=Clonostachys rhizophaga TaxID=160324 RepID=A0A9N9YJI3_9HYPO|nr:unnamed protein product [Clonostachys rhizophaga]